MQTPDDKAGKLTERIMAIFWAHADGPRLSTADYNRVYSHVYRELREADALLREESK